MLFYPWRSEDSLIGNCDSYEERYLQIIREDNYPIEATVKAAQQF